MSHCCPSNLALNTAAGRVHSVLGLTDAKHRAQAMIRLNQALADGSGGRTRQRAFNQAWLATCFLADGDPAAGAQAGASAVETVRGTCARHTTDPNFELTSR